MVVFRRLIRREVDAGSCDEVVAEDGCFIKKTHNIAAALNQGINHFPAVRRHGAVVQKVDVFMFFMRDLLHGGEISEAGDDLRIDAHPLQGGLVRVRYIPDSVRLS